MSFLRKSLAILILTGLLIIFIPGWNEDSPFDPIFDSDIKNGQDDTSDQDLLDGSTRGARLGKVESTKEAALISDEGMKTARKMLETAWTENITEADVVRAIDKRMVELGSSSMIDAFGLLVVSGNDTGIAGGHGDTSDDEVDQILPGEVVFIDIGARINGYVSDITRTFFMGEPTAQQREVYNITLDAQEAAYKLIKHGLIAGELDQAARKVITDAGYGEHFSHCVGHGIGLYIHIPPMICSDTMQPLSKPRDDIITIEPGIYIENDFGVRTEDDFIVEWNGYELITFYPRDIEANIIHPPENESEQEKESAKKWWESDSGKRKLISAGAGLILASAVVFFYMRKMRKNN